MRHLSLTSRVIYLFICSGISNVFAIGLVDEPVSIYEEQYLAVSVNGVDTRTIAVILKDKDGTMYIKKTDLSSWRMIIPDSKPELFRNEHYYSLKSFAGLSYDYNFSKLSINLKVPNMCLETTNIGEQELKHIKRPSNGGYLNYELIGRHNHERFNANNFFELGYFNKFGLGINSFRMESDLPYRYRRGHDGHDDHGRNKAVFKRLQTNWTYDNPEKMTTLVLGDTNTFAGSWNHGVYFGGVKYGTNFGTQPDYIKYPLPSVQGEAVLPTAVDLYIDNRLNSQNNFLPGPYSIGNIPSVDGYGNVKIVTTDPAGKQDTMVIPFYSTRDNLKKGLTNYSIEAGFVRKDYGLKNNAYGGALLSGTRLHGITDKLTSEQHIELQAKHQAAGYGINYVVGSLGTVSGAVAVSNHRIAKLGMLTQLGFQRRTPKYNFSIKSQLESPTYHQLGDNYYDDYGSYDNYRHRHYDHKDFHNAHRINSQASVGVPLGRGSVGLAYANRIACNHLVTQVTTVNYSFSFWHNIMANFSVNWQNGTAKSTSARVSLSAQIAPAVRMALNVRHERTHNDRRHGGNEHDRIRDQVDLSISKSIPSNGGFGYNADLAAGHNPVQRGSLGYQSSYGKYAAYARSSHHTDYALSASGSIIFLDGIHFANQVNNGFALVEIPGYPNINIKANGSKVARTNRSGNAFVTNLPPYYESTIGFDVTELPFNAALDASKKTISTFPKSGYIVKFPVTLSSSGTLTLVQENGQVVPIGAGVEVTTQDKKVNNALVGDEGLVYLTNLTENNLLDVFWEEHHCSVILNTKPTKTGKVLNDYGSFICKPAGG